TLLDVIFDFGTAGSEASEGLALALSGKFDQLLEKERTGVAIQEGVLAYALHKESHVALALPYFSTTGAHLNDSLAQLSHVQEDGGTLLYTLTASDLVTVKNDYSSGLAVSLALPGRQSAVLIHDPTAATYRYDLKVTAPQLTTAQLEHDYSPYINAYFTTE